LINEIETRLARGLIEEIHRNSKHPVRLMEFCGGHTVAILKFGLRQLLPPTVQLFSGPGCPVCVTSVRDIDKIIALSQQPGVITATFGDLLRVPGSHSSLQQSRAMGNDIRVVYSALEALDMARQCPEKTVVMIGIGFETTAPTIAASLLQAQKENLRNYKVLSLHKITPPVIQALLAAGEVRIDGIICPGHVSAIIGARPYDFIPSRFNIACAITGFKLLDILEGISSLVKQIEEGRAEVVIAYRSAVRPEGNLTALSLLDSVFEVTGAEWRGIGRVARSGYKINNTFREFDAAEFYKLSPSGQGEPAGCLCGDILRGVRLPADCRLFGRSCIPEHPVGPCMVSAEGACSAYYLYGGLNG